MQRELKNRAYIASTVSPLDDIGDSSAIDRTPSNYEDAKNKVKKIMQLISTGTCDAELAKYISGTLDLVYQGMIEDFDTKEKAAHNSYKEIEQIDFQIMLTDKYYINPSSIHLCFPMKIKKSSSTNSSIDTDLITVNNFCAHLVKEISLTRYGHDKQLISTFSPYEIYQYSESMPKHLPKNSLKKNRENTPLQQAVCIFQQSNDR